MECADECLKENKKCENKECKNWINFDEDNNCTLIAIEKNGSLNLHETAKRLNMSHVRIFQIEQKALKKLRKKIPEIDSYI